MINLYHYYTAQPPLHHPPLNPPPTHITPVLLPLCLVTTLSTTSHHFPYHIPPAPSPHHPPLDQPSSHHNQAIHPSTPSTNTLLPRVNRITLVPPLPNYTSCPSIRRPPPKEKHPPRRTLMLHQTTHPSTATLRAPSALLRVQQHTIPSNSTSTGPLRQHNAWLCRLHDHSPILPHHQIQNYIRPAHS